MLTETSLGKIILGTRGAIKDLISSTRQLLSPFPLCGRFSGIAVVFQDDVPPRSLSWFEQKSPNDVALPLLTLGSGPSAKEPYLMVAFCFGFCPHGTAWVSPSSPATGCLCPRALVPEHLNEALTICSYPLVL